MFGYVKTDLPYVYVKDTVLYKAIYCGLCKSIGKCCGNNARFVLNYDLAFLSLICHNLTDKDVKIEKQHCVIHPITKRPIAVPTELSTRIGALNVILAYYKLCDGVIDGDGGKVKKSLLKSAYKKASKKEPKLDEIVSKRFNELIEYEKTSGDGIDASSDPFGKMMQDIGKELLGEYATENTDKLFYALGKWIYLIDALDDFDKDKKKKSFNVLINLYKGVSSKAELIKEKYQDLTFLFGNLITEISTLADKLDYKFNSDLIKNVLTRGIYSQTKRYMEIEKCKNTTKF